MKPRWHGTKELVVGEFDEAGNIIWQCRIQPGEEIPDEVIEVIKKNHEIVPIPYYTERFVQDNLDRELVKRVKQ